MNLAALLFDSVRRLPERPAVSDDYRAWTFGELAVRIAKIAGGSRALGLVPATRAAITGKLRRVLRVAVCLLGGWAVRGSDKRSPASARSRIHRSKFRRPAAGRNAGLGRTLAPLTDAVVSLDRIIATRSHNYKALLATVEPVTPASQVRKSAANSRIQWIG